MNEALKEALMAAVITAIPFLMGVVGSALVRVKAYLDASTKNQYLLMFYREAATVVSAMNQKMAQPFKDASADGKLTADEGNAIKQAAKAALWEAVKDIPKHIIPDIAGKIEIAIEGAVNDAKNTPPTLPPVGVQAAPLLQAPLPGRPLTSGERL